MKKFLITNIFILTIFSLLLAPCITFAQCVATGCDTAEDAVFKTEVPAKDCVQNAFSTEGIVQCGRKVKCEYQPVKVKDASGKETGKWNVDTKTIVRTVEPCNFNDFINMINRIITYILALAVSIVAIMFAYAGFLFLTSAATPDSRTKAKNIFFDAAIGLIIAFSAFLIIKLLFSVLGYTEGGLFFK